MASTFTPTDRQVRAAKIAWQESDYEVLKDVARAIYNEYEEREAESRESNKNTVTHVVSPSLEDPNLIKTENEFVLMPIGYFNDTTDRNKTPWKYGDGEELVFRHEMNDKGVPFFRLKWKPDEYGITDEQVKEYAVWALTQPFGDDLKFKSGFANPNCRSITFTPEESAFGCIYAVNISPGGQFVTIYMTGELGIWGCFKGRLRSWAKQMEYEFSTTLGDKSPHHMSTHFNASKQLKQSKHFHCYTGNMKHSQDLVERFLVLAYLSSVLDHGKYGRGDRMNSVLRVDRHQYNTLVRRLEKGGLTDREKADDQYEGEMCKYNEIEESKHDDADEDGHNNDIQNEEEIVDEEVVSVEKMREEVKKAKEEASDFKLNDYFQRLGLETVL